MDTYKKIGYVYANPEEELESLNIAEVTVKSRIYGEIKIPDFASKFKPGDEIFFFANDENSASIITKNELAKKIQSLSYRGKDPKELYDRIIGKTILDDTRSFRLKDLSFIRHAFITLEVELGEQPVIFQGSKNTLTIYYNKDALVRFLGKLVNNKQHHI